MWDITGKTIMRRSVEITRRIFQWFVVQNQVLTPLKSASKRHSFRKVYPSQANILEGGTKNEIRISKEALFKGVSTRFGLRTIEKSVENLDFVLCSSFQNLRLGSIKLVRVHFSRTWVLHLGYNEKFDEHTFLKGWLNLVWPSQMFRGQIFVWGA